MRKLLLIAGLLITFSCIDEPCADVYDPVCTPDGTQCGNDCEARNAGVKGYTSCISWFKILTPMDIIITHYYSL